MSIKARVLWHIWHQPPLIFCEHGISLQTSGLQLTLENMLIMSFTFFQSQDDSIRFKKNPCNSQEQQISES